LRTSIALIPLMLAAPSASRCQADGHEAAWTQADSTVTVGSSQIGLQVSAWRDFMPSPDGTGGGSDLMVNLQISSLDAAPLPNGLVVDSAWVRSPEGLWQTTPSQEVRPDIPNGMDLILRGGPKWATDQPIDVLVRLQLPTGDAYYLEARRQPIGRTQ
jgi:hypothetical protein